MALTAQQETEVLTRLGAGERPGQIIRDMGIERLDFMTFRKANRQAVADAKDSKTARLARLNRSKVSLENEKVMIEGKLLALKAEIAAVKAEK